MTIPNRRSLTLVAMVCAVAMTFIDQTIVSIAAPRIQADLGLSASGLQWAVNAYLLAMAAVFALGGRLADTVGRRRTAVVGIGVFAVASALCGATPAGPAAAPWLIAFRALQGVGAALLYPAALAIVIDAYAASTRGRALALFFGVAGGFTAVGPALGGFLVAWTWRAIFWVNVPIAVLAVALILIARPAEHRRPARLDVLGLVLITAGSGSAVLGLQQSAQWGWADPRTLGVLAVAVALLAALVRVERRTASPLVDLAVLRGRSFAVDTVVLFGATAVFVPVLLFASEYGQLSLGETPAQASLLLLYFFSGFVVAAQVGGRMLDRGGARRPVVIGAVLTAVGLHEWADHVGVSMLDTQIPFIVLTGAGLGLLLGQANTDALNHASGDAYGAATGLTQTVRNLGASLGLAGVGTVLVTQFRSNLGTSLAAHGVPAGRAQAIADGIARLGGHRAGSAIPLFVRDSFAAATGSVLTVLSWIMVATAVAAFVGLPHAGRRHGRRVVADGALV